MEAMFLSQDLSYTLAIFTLETNKSSRRTNRLKRKSRLSVKTGRIRFWTYKSSDFVRRFGRGRLVRLGGQVVKSLLKLTDLSI